jgi:hypothetical protein
MALHISDTEAEHTTGESDEAGAGNDSEDTEKRTRRDF